MPKYPLDAGQKYPPLDSHHPTLDTHHSAALDAHRSAALEAHHSGLDPRLDSDPGGGVGGGSGVKSDSGTRHKSEDNRYPR